MAQGHMDRLSSVDVSFLTNEIVVQPHARGRGHDLRGARRRATRTCSNTSRRACTWSPASARSWPPPGRDRPPVLGRRPDFNLEYHVRHSALPAPGSEEQLRNMAARVFSAAARPHQAALGAVAGPGADPQALRARSRRPTTRWSTASPGVDIATVLFDAKPVPEPAEPDHEWVPTPIPVERELAAKGLEESPSSPLRLARRWSRRSSIRARPRPGGRGAEGVGEIGWAFANPAPKVPLNVEIGSHRRFVWVRSDLAQFKRIKDALGGTVNDVVLAVVAGGVRGWLHARGIRTEGLELRAQVPVSIRGRGRARAARQPARGDARPAAGLHRGPGPAPAA